MSWFETSTITSLAKNAIKEAQKKIDKALDIKDEENAESFKPPPNNPKNLLKKESDDFFASFGLTDESTKKDESTNKSLVGSSIWGSFTGSFFENIKPEWKEKDQSCSEPSTRSDDQIVATQPPRNNSNISSPTKSSSPLSSPPKEDPIGRLENTGSSLLAENASLQSSALILPDSPSVNISQSSCDEVEIDDWNWSNQVFLEDLSFKGDALHKSKEVSDVEESDALLQDDTEDRDGFTRSRLVVQTAEEVFLHRISSEIGDTATTVGVPYGESCKIFTKPVISNKEAVESIDSCSVAADSGDVVPCSLSEDTGSWSAERYPHKSSDKENFCSPHEELSTEADGIDFSSLSQLDIQSSFYTEEKDSLSIPFKSTIKILPEICASDSIESTESLPTLNSHCIPAAKPSVEPFSTTLENVLPAIQQQGSSVTEGSKADNQPLNSACFVEVIKQGSVEDVSYLSCHDDVQPAAPSICTEGDGFQDSAHVSHPEKSSTSKSSVDVLSSTIDNGSSYRKDKDKLVDVHFPTITHQPISSSITEQLVASSKPRSGLNPEDELKESLPGTTSSMNEIGTDSESIYSYTRSDVHAKSATSSTTTLVGSTTDLLLESNEIFSSNTCENKTVCPLKVKENIGSSINARIESEIPVASDFLSMNAGEIRKKLVTEMECIKDCGVDNTGIQSKGFAKNIDSSGSSAGKGDNSDSPLSSSSAFCFLEVSSRSESSSDTVTTSQDAHCLDWSDLTRNDNQCEAEDCSEDVKNESTFDSVATKCMSDQEFPELNKTGLTFEPSDSDLSCFENYGKNTKNQAISPVSSDRSYSNKVPSCSSQSSLDENETTNSSDIEVISSPSVDGSTHENSRSSFGASAVAAKMWFSAQKGLRSLIHEKVEGSSCSLSGSGTSSQGKKENNSNGSHGFLAETVPSSMTTSFTSLSESDGDNHHILHLSDTLHLEASSKMAFNSLQTNCANKKGHKRSMSCFSENGRGTVPVNYSPEIEKLKNRLKQLNEILEARESKVLELSQSNVSLQVLNVSLKSRLDELECQNNGSDNVEGIREEFTQRLVTMEKKFQQALREKEAMKKQLEELRANTANLTANVDLRKEIEEKDSMINELRGEGEKLSKQQLNYSTLLKKLRSREKETENEAKKLKEKVDHQSAELDRLHKQLEAKEDVERNQIDAVRQLTQWKVRQEKEESLLKAENTELEGKLTSLKEALEIAYKEMNELRESSAQLETEAQKVAHTAEVTSKQKLDEALASSEKRREREQEAFLAQIKELQESLSRYESLSNRKERQLKEDLKEMQVRLSDSEARTTEMSNSISASTRPLLRQIENLQTSHQMQQSTWETLEVSLTNRLNDTQAAALLSAKKEREAKEHLASVIGQISSLQSQMSSLQAENATLKSKLEVSETQISTLEDSKAKVCQQLTALKASFAEEVSELKRERDVLEQQLEVERTAVSAEKRKCASYQDQLNEKERKISQLTAVSSNVVVDHSHQSSPRSSPTPSLSRLSISGSVDEVFDSNSWAPSNYSRHHYPSSIYETVRVNSTVTIDALTSAVRQREGDVHHLRCEVSKLEMQKESLAQELVKASQDLENHELQTKELHELKESNRNLEQKYNALLQLYGEKVEEVDELRLDLQDVKEMYKLQIDQILQK